MDKGFYTLTQDDKNLSEFFDDREYTLLMKRIYRQIGFSRGFTEEARKACGYPKDKLHRDEISKSRVFVVTDKAIRGISWSYCPVLKPKEIVSIEDQNKVKKIALFANYLGANIKELQCSSTHRTSLDQAKIIFNKFQNKEYGAYSLAYSYVKDDYTLYESKPYQFVDWDTYMIEELEKAVIDIKSKYPDKYLMHVNENNGKTFDIAPKNSNLDSGTNKEKFIDAFKKFRSNGYIKNNSFYYYEILSEKAYHFVMP